MFQKVQGSQITTSSTKPKITQKTTLKTTLKTTQKTREKILAAIKETPATTSKDLAEITGITIKGIEWQLKKLQPQGIIRRVGPDKGGHWEIVQP